MVFLSCDAQNKFDGKWVCATFDLSNAPSFKPNANSYLENTIEINGSVIQTSMMENTLDGTIYNKHTFEILDTRDTCGIHFFILKKKENNILTFLPVIPHTNEMMRFETLFIKTGDTLTREKINEYIQLITEKYTTFPIYGEIYRTPSSYKQLKKLPIIQYPIHENEYLDFLNDCNDYLLKYPDLVKTGMFCPRIPEHLDEFQQEVLISKKLNPYTSIFVIQSGQHTFFSEKAKAARQKFLNTFDSIYIQVHPRKPRKSSKE